MKTITINPVPDDARARTAVIGGLKDCGNIDEAYKMVTDTLWSKWSALPEDYYCKGDFEGLIFLKFATNTDRDAAINVIKTANLKKGDHKIWAKPDQAFVERMNNAFLFGVKHLMVDGWGYDRKSV